MFRAATRYAVIALLFVLACFLQGGEIRHSIQVLLRGNTMPEYPFHLLAATRTIDSGPFAGNQLLAIDGRPLVSVAAFRAAVRSGKPGEMLQLTMGEPSGRAIERRISLAAAGDAMNAGEIVVRFWTTVLIPAVSIAFGFGAVATRPADPNAWLMLLVLLGFSEVIQHRTWSGPVPVLTQAWAAFWMLLWPASTAGFGLRFPERFTWDKKRPWIKFPLIALAVGAGLFYFAIQILWDRNINAAQVFRRGEERAYFIWLGSLVAGAIVFFWSPGAKMRTSATADDRRRLKILLFGSILAFAPALFIALYEVVSGRDLFRGVPWPINAVTLSTITLFPLALAYVVVVERAMDLHFLIRQILKYAVAKGGLYFIRLAVLACAVYIIVQNSGKPGHGVTAFMQLVALGLLLVVFGRRRTAVSASEWIDRRIFREAYNAEKKLGELANEPGRVVEIGPLLQYVAARLGETLHVVDIVVLLREGSEFRTRYSTRPGEPLDIPADSAIAAAIAQRPEPLRVWFERPPLWIRGLGARDLQTLDFMRTEILVPIPGKDGLAGIVSLGPKLSEEAYSVIDLRLTQSVAAQMGRAVENNLRIDKLLKPRPGNT